MSEDVDNITVLFGGDFAPCRRFESIVIEKNETIFNSLIHDIEAADIAFINLECPLTNSDSPIKKSGTSLKASPKCIDALKRFSVIGLANNHIMDYGNYGLQETLKICKKNNLLTVGAGETLEVSQRPLLINKKGVKVAIIAIAEHEFGTAGENEPGAAPFDIIDNVKQIEQLKNDSDLIFVTIHGGNEYYEYPRPGLRKACKFYIEHGVDGVFCHHPHIPGSYEFYNDKPIVYSMGNLLFDHDSPPKGWDEGYMVQIKFDVKSKAINAFDVIPYNQSVHIKGVTKMINNNKKEFLRKVGKLNRVLESELLYIEEWYSFCKKREDITLLNQYSPVLFRGIGKLMRLRLFKRMLLPKTSLYRRKNIVECESHYEVLKVVLNRMIKQ